MVHRMHQSNQQAFEACSSRRAAAGVRGVLSDAVESRKSLLDSNDPLLLHADCICSRI
jgi:hypothetical protein